MSSLPPGANAALPAAPAVTLRLTTDRAHADLVVLCVRGDGTADGDNGVALWSQPSTAGGAVTIDTATDTVTVLTDRVPADVQRLLVVAQADGVPDMSGVGALHAAVAAGGTPVATLDVASPPAMPTVQVGEVYRHGAGWKVRCLGDGYQAGLARLLQVHGIDVADDEPADAAPAAAPAASAGSPGVDLEKQRRIDLHKKVQATGSVSLTKKFEAAGVSLEKSGLVGQRAEVILVLDVSGSSRQLFKRGYPELVERFLAAALHFDDDGTIPAYLFDTSLHEAPDITLANFQTWTGEVFKRRDIWGGTMYAPPIEAIARTLTRGKAMPTYVAFVTDGGNFDRRPTSKALQAISGLPAFFGFMAVGREKDFPFLQKLDDLKGREVDNASFFATPDPLAMSDDEFYAKIMKEFPQWIEDARMAGILG